MMKENKLAPISVSTDWLDDKILSILEKRPYWGARIQDVVFEVQASPEWSANKGRSLKNLVRTVIQRMQWLADHGFVFHSGKAGNGSRWQITDVESSVVWKTLSQTRLFPLRNS